MSRDHKEPWVCPFCEQENTEDVRYASNAPGYYQAGQWYPDNLPAIRCQRCEFGTTWFDVDTEFALQKIFQKDPDSHRFGIPMGGN
jgi:hypothetical protein